MSASSSILSRRDLDFLLYEWLDVEALTKRPRYAEHSRETFDAVLELAEQIATEHFAPHNRTADEHEPRIVDGKVELIPEVAEALTAFAEAGLMAGSFDEAVGGMQLPHTVAQAALRLVPGRERRHVAYPFLTMGNANLLLAHGSPEQVDTYVRADARRAASSAPCACPSRRPGPRWPTSPPAPSRRTTAPTGCPATRCGSPAATTSWPRTSSTWCWPRSPAGRPG